MEEHINPQQHSRSSVTKAGGSTKMIISFVVVIAVAAFGFFGGMQYQKGKTSSTGMTMTSQSGNGYAMGGAGGQNGRMGEFGTVTAVTSSSISVKSERTSSTATYTISSATTITNNGSTASYSDIAVGDTVIVETSSSDSSTASRIVINPSMNGGPQMDNSSGTTTQTN